MRNFCPKLELVIMSLLLLSVATAFVAVADTTSDLPKPSYPSINDLVAQGKLEEALTLTDNIIAHYKEISPAELLLIRADIFFRLGQMRNYEDNLLLATAREPALKILAFRKLIESRLQSNDVDTAYAYYNQIYRNLSSGEKAYFLLKLAGGFLDANQIRQAESLYLGVSRLFRRGSYKDWALLGMARTSFKSGKSKTALGYLYDLKTGFTSFDAYSEAITLETQILGQSENLQRTLTEGEYRKIVRRLNTLSRFDATLNVIDSWTASYPKSEHEDTLDYEIISTLTKMRANEEALIHCQQFAQNHPRSKLYPNVRFFELLLNQRIGNTKRVKELGDAFWQGKFGGSMSIRRSATLLLAAYLVSVGEVTSGLDYYRLVYRSNPGNSSRINILWRVGVGALRDNQLDRSVANFKLLLQKRIDQETLRSTLFWKAVAERKRSNPQESIKLLARLNREFKYHYYGTRATELLQEILKENPELLNLYDALAAKQENLPEFPDTNISEKIVNTEQFVAAETFNKAALYEDATYFLSQLKKHYPSNKGLSLLLARTQNKAGHYRDSIRTIYNAFSKYVYSGADGQPADFWELYYPRPYMSHIEQAAKAYDLDPMLMLSIMRQESRFDPQARSGVGAIGLFQIMPYTAEEIGPKIGLPELSAEDLHDPEVNSKIAAYLASLLIDYFDNSHAPIIASYNAGEDRVEAWWLAAVGDDISEELFIDTIPYRETRSFVREVLGNYFAYKRIYQQDEQTSD